jgi:hypothetical protein
MSNEIAEPRNKQVNLKTEREGSPGPPGKKHSRLEVVDIVAKLLIAGAGVALSWVIGWSTLQNNRQAQDRQMKLTEQQVRLQSEASVAQRRVAAAQILISQLPRLVQGTDQDRSLSLQIVQLVDPDLVTQIGELLLARATNSTDQQTAKRVIASSLNASKNGLFAQRVSDARRYRELGLEAAAVREYLKAAEMLPSAAKTPLTAAIEAATKDYERGDFSAAARTLDQALQGVLTPFAT